MKIIFTFSFLTVLLIGSIGCYRNDTRTASFNVPQIQTQECLNFLAGRLRGAEGVIEISGTLDAGTVTVQFDGMKLALKNIEYLISSAGFDVNETPAVPEAKASLPVPCR